MVGRKKNPNLQRIHLMLEKDVIADLMAEASMTDKLTFSELVRRVLRAYRDATSDIYMMQGGYDDD